MRTHGPTPSVVAYNIAINAQARTQQWDRALGLLQDMKSQGIAPNEVSYQSIMGPASQVNMMTLYITRMFRYSEIVAPTKLATRASWGPASQVDIMMLTIYNRVFAEVIL